MQVDDEVLAAGYSTAAPQEIVSVATNGAALKNSYKITVSEAGIQEVLFSAIGGVTDSNKLRLTHRGRMSPSRCWATGCASLRQRWATAGTRPPSIGW